ncbi:MBL fold metallo-hydrolase [Blattabacterium cuenoti]|uniref:MBL fold metallo-hydrolase n=1 Tax=Blattabacterium cuenoti TaxID=1653831 RepID=UPI00163C84FA|nr:MBL fold metallo-hydrolase [Blattabacterium cuenoti]
MKITFLGTGNSIGIPIIGSKHPVCLSNNSKDKRLRSSIIIEINNKYFLIDCSPDFRYQMLKNNYNKIDAILITHEHYDHIGGLEDIRPINNKNNKEFISIPIYSSQRVLENIKKRLFYIYNKKTNIIKVNLLKIEKNYNCFSILNEKVYPLFIWHGLLPILGFRIKNFAYIIDASFIPNSTIRKLNGLDILILNIFKKKHNKNIISFSNLFSQTLKFIRTIRPKKVYLTHISNTFGFHEKIQKNLPKNIYLAYDGLII